MIRLADYVVEFLEDLGVRTVFTVSGGGSIFLCDALAQAKHLTYYCCHHEQAVSIASEGYARCSGDLGVAMVTTGPGGTNSVTGVAGAWIDSTPQLTISGQVYLQQTIGASGVRQLGVQEINIIDIVKPITKYAVMVTDPQQIRYHLEKAVYLTTSGRPGPAWVDIPADIQNAKIDPNLLSGFEPESTEVQFVDGIDEAVREVADMLLRAKRPLLHAGQGVRLAGAQEALLRFAERHNLPVATTWNATDIIDSSHPLFVGRPGAFAERGANFVVQNADFYLALGSRLPFMVTGYNSKDFARNAKRVMVDIDPTESNKECLDLHVKVQADVGHFLGILEKTVPPDWRIDSTWIKQCQAWRQKYPIVLPEYRTQLRWVNSYYFIELLSEALDAQAVVVTDMGLSFVGTHQAFRVKSGQRVFTNSGHAPMGWGLPATVGACLAAGKAQTVCLSGEGGLMMNVQELATVMHNQLPIKLFIYNNGGYLTIKQTQQLGFEGRLMGSTPDSGISFPDFGVIAQAHRISYRRFENNTDLQNGLAGFLEEEGPGICELMIDPEQPQIPKSINKRRADGTTEPTVFEDLYPFLDGEELKANMLED